MAYEDLVQWMFNLERFGIKLGLDNMTEFLSRIGDPHRDFRSIHVTGTNGKGSVCAFLASMLAQGGYRVGLYTSPHLVDFRERVRVNGSMISQEDVVRIGGELRSAMETMAQESSEKQLTFFEFTTGLAFKHFSEMNVDVAVVEVGMGGRLDATNVITPEVAGITRVGLEHTAYLGRTTLEIAREKAGIIKTRIPVVSCERSPEIVSLFKSICGKREAELRLVNEDFRVENRTQTDRGSRFDFVGVGRLEGLQIPLIGDHQIENAAMAVAMTELLSRKGFDLSEETIRTGLAETEWKGRLEIWSTNPLVILDGSHNPEGVETAVRALKARKMVPLTYIVACMDDKDATGIIRALSTTAARLIVTQVDIRRSMSAADLMEVAAVVSSGDIEMCADIGDALDRAMAEVRGEGVCVIGSFYLVGEAIKQLSLEGSDA